MCDGGDFYILGVLTHSLRITHSTLLLQGIIAFRSRVILGKPIIKIKIMER